MKKTTFKNMELLVSITFDQVYMDTLLANEIEYTIRDIPLFQSLLPPEIIAYNGYEVIYEDANGEMKYVYPFVTIEYDSTKCVTFFPGRQLDNIFLLDLEQAMRSEKLVYETIPGSEEEFKGFDLSGEINLGLLVGTSVNLKDGSSYEFTSLKEFPEGVCGKHLLTDGKAINVMLVKIDGPDLLFAMNEAGSGWKLLDKDTIQEIFG